MAFTKAKQNKSGNYDTVSWDKNVEKIIEGHYLGKKENVGGRADKYFYIVKTKDITYAVWPSKALDDYFPNIEVGDYIRIEFLGAKKLNGGKTFNDFEIQVDPDRHEDF